LKNTKTKEEHKPDCPGTRPLNNKKFQQLCEEAMLATGAAYYDEEGNFRVTH
jgi:hypothetical protein